MKYFLTGGTGFIGSHVVHQLVDLGHEVVALVRSPSKATLLPEDVQIVVGDVTEKATMHDAMTGSDGVFHLAGWYRLGISDGTMATRINVEGTRNVLELMRELEIPKGVYTSSVAVFSDTRSRCVDESYRSDGPHRSVYDRTKWRAHYEVAEPLIDAGLPLVIVMPGAVYGPTLSGAGYMSDLRALWRRYLTRELPFVIRTGAACWDHVADSAHAHVLAMTRGKPGETYIIAGEKRTFVEVFTLAEDLTGIPTPRTVSPRWFRALAPVVARVERFVTPPRALHSEVLYRMSGESWLGDNSKATVELGLTHRPLEEGLGDYLAWEQEQLECA